MPDDKTQTGDSNQQLIAGQNPNDDHSVGFSLYNQDLNNDDSAISDQSSDFLIGRLRNSNAAGEGSNVPPALVGEFRVPFVKGFQVISNVSVAAGTQFTLCWYEPEGFYNLATFNIYVRNAYNSNDQPTFLGASSHSPCTFTIPNSIGASVVFFCQTTLTNGMTAPLLRCPTCTSSTVTPPAPTPVEKTVVVTGLTLTSNSPGAGRVAWSACSVLYNGTTYAIASGNSLTTDKQITWTVGAGVFVAAASYTPSDSIFLIATNTGGTANEAWNRQGTALSSVQDSQLTSSLLKGFAIQPSASITLTNLVFPFSATTATTNILTVNQACALLSARIFVTTPITISSPGSSSGNVDIYLRITVDGATPQTLRIFPTIPANVGGTTTAPTFDGDIATYSTAGTGSGANANDNVVASFGISCAASLVIDSYITDDNTNGTVGSRTLTGSVNYRIGYALKTAA